MKKKLVVFDVSNISEADLLRRSNSLADSLDKHAAELPNVEPTATELRAKASILSSKRVQVENLKAQIAELDQQIEIETDQLKDDIKSIGSYTESVVNKTNNWSLVQALGFRFKESASTNSELGVPLNLHFGEIEHTSGKLKVLFKPVDNANSYGIVFAYGDTPPTEWSQQAIKVLASSRKNYLSFDSGKRVWARVKAYGPNNTESDWSDVATRIVP
ncbi:MAG: hypothetical protein KA783_02710 [Chitinophagales bacterium]|nr:hypothetical protein [Sphingobacteriales bacterium]MBP7533331.1 hypothetical protein [Chitinophagales bacterium]